MLLFFVEELVKLFVKAKTHWGKNGLLLVRAQHQVNLGFLAVPHSLHLHLQTDTHKQLQVDQQGLEDQVDLLEVVGLKIILLSG